MSEPVESGRSIVSVRNGEVHKGTLKVLHKFCLLGDLKRGG